MGSHFGQPPADSKLIHFISINKGWKIVWNGWSVIIVLWIWILVWIKDMIWFTATLNVLFLLCSLAKFSKRKGYCSILGGLGPIPVCLTMLENTYLQSWRKTVGEKWLGPESELWENTSQNTFATLKTLKYKNRCIPFYISGVCD